MHREHSGLLSVNMHALASPLYYTHTPQLRSTRYILSHTVRSLPDRAFARGRCSLNIDYYNSFLWKISRNPTFSVPNNPQSPTLLGSNLGTKSYVLRSPRDLLLSNSRLFSPGHTLSPRFLSLGNTRRVPVTRPSGTPSRSNSPGYPRRTPSRRGLFHTHRGVGGRRGSG
jgi:hypothetical protein